MANIKHYKKWVGYIQRSKIEIPYYIKIIEIILKKKLNNIKSSKMFRQNGPRFVISVISRDPYMTVLG